MDLIWDVAQWINKHKVHSKCKYKCRKIFLNEILKMNCIVRSCTMTFIKVIHLHLDQIIAMVHSPS